LKALFYDWLLICLYLILLFIATAALYFFVLDGAPAFTNVQAQLVACITSVIPIVFLFSILEGRKPFASWGKTKANLHVIYRGKPMTGSIIRNTLKFLPWQFGHMSAINGVYRGFDTPFSMMFLTLSMTLLALYVLMALLRSDGRHLADLASGSRVVKN